MKKGTILKNLYAGHETYFINMGFPVRTGKAEAKAIGGYSLTKVDGEWRFERAQYYIHSLCDTEHFPIVGYVDLKKTCIEAILKALFELPREEKENKNE